MVASLAAILGAVSVSSLSSLLTPLAPSRGAVGSDPAVALLRLVSPWHSPAVGEGFLGVGHVHNLGGKGPVARPQR